MNLVIGICGGSGSGKTLISSIIKEKYKDQVLWMPLDSYCISPSDKSYEERSKVNYDIPQSYDGEMMARDVLKLKENKIVQIPVYNFSKHLRENFTQEVKPNTIIICEGILTFAYQSLLDLFDIKIFVDAPENIRFERRLKRDIVERGRTVESVTKQFRETVAPMHKIHIEPTKKYADFIVKNEHNDGKINIDDIFTFIDRKLEELK